MSGDSVGDAAAAGPSRASIVRRKRTPRVTSGQIDALLAHLEARPFLFTRKFTGLQGRENFDSGWKEVAQDLNKLPNASVKTPEQWMTVWRDLKSRACSKAAKLSRERVQTGNRTITTAPLNEVERRIISITGVDYTFGTDCPDSMPEENILQHEPDGGVIYQVLSLPQSECNELELIGTEATQQLPVSDTTAAVVASPLPSDMAEQVPVEVTLQAQAPQITVNTSRAAADIVPPPMLHQERSRRNRNLNPRRSIAEQHFSARKDFLTVAESNAESMRMLAAATQIQAEAAKMQAEAAKVQAEASLVLAQAANKIADAIALALNKNNI